VGVLFRDSEAEIRTTVIEDMETGALAGLGGPVDALPVELELPVPLPDVYADAVPSLIIVRLMESNACES
jgi:hypothetical protein